MKTWLKSVLLALGMIGLSGCAGAILLGGLAAGGAAGAGAVAYSKGELRATENVSMDQAYNAGQTALKDLELPIIDRSKDALNAKLLARGSGDKKIVLQLKNKGAQMTEIRVRIGTFGDEALSRRILDAMKKRYSTSRNERVSAKPEA